MNLHLKQGYYKDIRACEEIARDSVLYERYFAHGYRTEDYIRAYFPDDGRGRRYFAETAHGEKAGLMVISRVPLSGTSVREERVPQPGRRRVAAGAV